MLRAIAVRHIGAGETTGLVIALAGWRAIRYPVRVKGLLKAELKRRNVTYKDLSTRLEAMGIHETAPNPNNKISRGGFSAVFLIQCLAAAGCQTLRISED